LTNGHLRGFRFGGVYYGCLWI